jgi:transcriptional regulator with XRE-family HTH domain
MAQTNWLGQRLALLEKENKLSGRKLALSVDFNPSNYGQVRRGTRGLPKDKAIALSQKYSVPLDWLLREDAERVPIEGVQVPFDDFMEVPDLSTPEAVAGFVAAGGSDEFVEKLPKLLLPKEYDKGNYLVIKVTQDSMDDGTDEAIKEGDKVLCKQLFWSKKEKPLHQRDNVYVICHRDGSMVFKEIVDHNVKSGLILCHSWNPDKQDYSIFLEDVVALFEVKKLVERPIRARRHNPRIVVR